MTRRSVGLMLGGALGLLAYGALQADSVRAEGRAQGATKRNVELIYLDHMDVSPPLREMNRIPPDWARSEEMDEHPVKRWPHNHAVQALASQHDAALQTAVTPAVSATAGLNFDGVGVPNYTISGAPPDTTGATGTTQYVQWVNTAFAVFNKSTGAMVYGPANGNTLWQGFGGRCETDNSGDPIVMFDRIANRWVMTQFAVSASPYYQCIAVSTTADATGTYRRFAYQYGSDFNDYGKAGVWPDGYYIAYNMFANGSTWAGAKVCAFDRVQMISAAGTPGPQQCFQLSTTYGGLLPADLDGSTLPPAGAPNPFVAFDDVGLNGVNVWKFHVDWATPANTTFTGPTKVNGAAFTEACNGGTCITQSGTTQKLDSLADRMMYRAAYRNFGSYESLVTNHSVDVSGHSGVRWYELRNLNGTPTMFQQGTFSPDTNHRWMGSIAQDQQGNMMVGYSTSGSVKPSVRYTGRLATDATGTMQTETEMFAGLGSQTANLSRWGDYSTMSIDPSDDCTFWFTTEYLKTNGTFNWSTRVGSFKFPGCGGVPTPDFSVATNPSSLTINAGASGTSTVTVSSLNGFNSAVSLSASGLPSGVTASFSPASVTPPSGGNATSTLTLTAASNAASSTSSVTVTGTSGSTTRTASVSLTVNGTGAASYDATLKAPKCSTVSSVCDSGASLLLGRAALGPEPNQPNTINSSCADGTAGTFHVDESNDRLKAFTTDGTDFAPGKTVTVQATVWAYSSFSSDHLDLYYAANANSPTWTLIGTVNPTAAGAQTLSANFTLPSGTLQAVRANFRYNGAAGSCTTGTYDDRDDLVFAVGGGDTTAPTTSITAPANGATVSGTTTISASASDNVGVTKVEFYVDSVLKSTDTTSPYSYAWDTTTYANGSHSTFSKAYDAAGNVGTSATISVTVSNVDTTAPTTSITSPASGATVGGTTTISASASDNVGVTKVEFYVDSVLKSTDTTSPYSYAWDTSTYANGSHSLFTKAYDAAGNIGTSATISVSVSNGGPVTVFYDGAESASTTFTLYAANTGTQWIRQASAPYAGTYRWKAGSSTGGNYSNNGDARLTTPTLNLSGASTVTLTYAYKYSTESGYDFFEVAISTDGGTTWTNLSRNSGTSSGYTGWAPLATVNLNSYAGQTNVKLRFRLTTDYSVTAFGAAVDEVKVVKQ